MDNKLQIMNDKKKTVREALVSCLLLSVLMVVTFFTSDVSAVGGDVLWEYGVSPMAGKQQAVAMAVDSEGNVIITGLSGDAGSEEFFTTKIAADGSGVVWSRLNVPEEGGDPATDIVVDSDDNIIVTGYAWNGTSFDFLTVKYDGLDGTVLWQHAFNPEFNGDDYNTTVAVDSLNNVYIGGNSQATQGKDDIVLIKYGPDGPNPDGTPIWQTNYNGAANGHDRITSIAAGVGGIALGGLSESSDNDFDTLTLKLDFAGNIIWEKRKAASGYDRAEVVKLDSAGHVVMTGTVYNGASKDIYAVKYDSATGNVIWEDTYDGGYNEEPEDLVIDSFDNVYITGYTFLITSDEDVYTAKYNGNTGALVWREILNSSNGNKDVGKSIAVDESGDVFVAADAYDSLAEHYNFLTIKFSKAAGNVLWEKVFDGAAQKLDRVAGVGVTPSGEAIVAGYSDMWTLGESDYDYYAIKYDPGLLNPPTDLSATAASTSQVDLTWSDNSLNEEGFKVERKIGDFGTYSEIATAAADSTSYSDTGLSADTKYYYRVRSYNAADGDSYYSNETYAVTTIVAFNSPSNVYIYPGSDGGDDIVTDLVTGPDYHPVLTGYSYSLIGQFDYLTMKLDRSDLSLVWDGRYDSDQNSMDIAVTILTDSNNDVLVSGTSYLFSVQSGENTNDIYSIKYPSSGPPEEWDDQYNGPAGDDDRSSIVDVASDGSDNYVVVGYGRNFDWNDDIYVVKYLPDGTREWAAVPYDGGVMGHDYPASVVFDSSGDIFLAGYTYNGSDFDFLVRRYSGVDGSVVWTDVYDIAGTGNDYTRAMVLDLEGNLYVSGLAVTASGNEDFYTIKYDGSDGTRIWEKSYNGIGDGIDEAVSIKVDPVNNDIVVAGTTMVSSGNNDIHLIRYDSDGSVIWERTLDRPDEDDFAVDMDIDLSGNVHIAGDTDKGSDIDIISALYSSEGSFLGGTLYNGAAGDDDGVASVSVNGLGEAFIGGYTYNSDGDADYVVYKLANTLLQTPAPFVVTPIYEDAVLDWTDNSLDEDGYHIERITGPCSSGNWLSLYTAVQNETSYTDSNLSIGAEYCYRIRTFKNNGETSRWVERGISTYHPTAPTDLVATSISTTEIELVWTDSLTGEEGFRIEKCEGAGCTDFAEIAVIASDSSAYIDDTVCSGSSYSYRIKAFKTGRWTTGYSNVASLVASTQAGPSSIYSTAISEAEARISWVNTSGDETGFEVQRCEGDALSCIDDADYTYSAMVTSPFTTEPVMLLRMDESEWDGTADEVNDSSGGDNHGTAYNGATTDPLAYSGNAGIFDGNDDYVSVPSSVLDGLTDFTVEFRANTTGSLEGIVSGANESTDNEFLLFDQASLKVTVKGWSWDSGVSLNDGVFHHIAIVREGAYLRVYKDGVLESEYDNAFTGALSIASNGLVIGQEQDSVGGDFDPDQAYDGILDEFAIYAYALSGVEIQEHYSNGVPASTIIFNDTAASYSTTYTYRVRSYKDALCPWESSFSSNATVTTSIQAPDTLTAETLNTTSIELSWNDRTATEDGFKVERCEGSGCSGFSEIGFVGPDIESYTDEGACENMVYTYRVRAYRDLEWNSSYSNEASAATNAKAAPQSLSAAAVSESRIDLGWVSYSDDESVFEVQRCEGLVASCTEDTDFTYSTDVSFNINPPLSSWPLDEAGGTSAQDSFGGNHGTVYGASWDTGKFGGGLNFNGTSNYVDAGSDASLDIVGDMTLEAWVNPNDTSGWEAIIAKWGNSYIIALDNASHRIAFHIDAWRYSNSSVPAGVWSHVAVVFDSAADTVKFYLNGNPDGVFNGQSSNQGTNGSLYLGQWGNKYWFNGLIDAPAVYDRALSAEEIQANYSLGTSSRTYSDTGLNAGTAYTYRVRARKDAGSPACDWQTVFTNTADAMTTLPPAPTDLTATVTSSTSINLSWTDNTDSETGFRIQRCTGPDCNFSVVDEFIVGPDIEFYDDSSACENTTYRYRVRAEKDTLNTYETTWEGPTGDVSTTEAAAPELFTAETVTETQINLTWTDNNDDETGFQIERCQGVGCSNYEVLAVTSTTVDGNVLYLKMDETAWDGTMGEVVDSSGEGNHGTSVNSANTVSGGKYGRAGSFNGNTFVEIPDSASLDITQAITMEAWVKLDSYPTEWNLIAIKGDTGNSRAYGMWVRNTGDILISYRNSNSYHLYPEGQGFTLGSWHHVVGIIDTANDYRAIYIDGLLRASSTAAIPSMAANNHLLYIGSRGGTWPSSGLIDEVAIFNRALSEEEVLAHFNTGLIDTSYTDTGLTTGETYRYRMSTYKDAACSWTTEYVYDESSTDPPPPGNFTAFSVGTNSIKLTWQDMNEAEDGFIIERCTGAGCSDFTELIALGPGLTSYTDNTVCENTTYRYRAKSYRTAMWESVYTDEKEVTSDPVIAPSGLTAVRVSETRIDLSWDDNIIDESQFVLERCSGVGCAGFSETAILAPNSSSYIDSGIMSETSYSYRIKALSSADCPWESGYSNVTTAETALTAPGGLSAVAVNTTDVSLYWTDNTWSESLFSIERCTGTGCTDFAEIDTVESNNNSYTDVTACNSTTYTYRIRGRKEGALSADGQGCWTRRAPVEITGFMRDHQTRLVVPYDSDMKSDFSDLRFYDASSGSERPYWIETKEDGVSATLYFKTLGVNDLYMYYGNASATSVSSGTDTFDLYDPTNSGLVSQFTKDASNPVMNTGAANTWDDAHVYGMTVIIDEGLYKMWYSGNDGVYWRIGYATSTDGKNWTRHASNPVLALSVNGGWDDYHVAYPRVIKDNGVYRMWYSGNDGSNWRTGYAESTDGINWTKYASNPVMNPGTGGAWDDVAVIAGTVVKENNNSYWMWYSGNDGSRYRIGYAKSSDGLNWIKGGTNPVVSTANEGSWEGEHVYMPMVLKEADGSYYMWYTGHSGDNTRIGYAYSADGMNWSKTSGNIVINIGANESWDDLHVYGPFVLRNSDGYYEMWYSGYDGSAWRVGYASVRPSRYTETALSASVGAEEESTCYTYHSWSTEYSEDASATTFGLGAPGSLLAVASGDTRADLTYTDNSIDETGFSIERCTGDSCSDFSEISTVPADSTSFQDMTINPASSYCFRVRAYKTAACGWETSYTNQSCDLSYPSRPTDLVATALNSVIIELEWTDNANDEDGFELEKRLFNGTYVKIAQIGPDVTSFTDTIGLEAEKEFSYRIRSFRGDDKSPYSNIASAVTPAWQELDASCSE